jgi:drug/metabolite transporter (DMT)-like permease
MKSLLESIRDILLLRRGPQDLPFSAALLGTLILFALAIGLAVSAQRVPVAVAAPQLGFEVLLLLALAWIPLAVARRRERFVQTATALVAAAIAFNLLAVPVVLGVGELPRDPRALTTLQVVLGWLSLALLAWKLVVSGHVLRHALDVPLRIGVLIAAAFLAGEVVLNLALFGAQGTPATP